MTRILFVCTGNTCRSPLAECLMRKLAQDSGVQVETRSAGLAALDGTPMSRHSQTLLERKGASHPFQSHSLTSEMVKWADLILTMTMNHKGAVVRSFPEAVDKTHTLKEFAQAGDSGVNELQEQRAQLLADLQIKQSLGQSATSEEARKLRELERAMPGMDIADPFGGPLREYEETAEEIEAELIRVIQRLKRQ